MSEEQLNEAIQYNLDYLEGNIDFEEEYKELAKSYSNLYDKLQQKENIIKEAIEKIKESCWDYEYETYSNMTSDEVKELVEILNKAGDK